MRFAIKPFQKLCVVNLLQKSSVSWANLDTFPVHWTRPHVQYGNEDKGVG